MTDRRRQKAEGLAPSPPAGERDRRLRRVRNELARRDVGGLLVYGSGPTNPDPVRYLAGYVHPFPRARSLLFVPQSGRTVLLIDRDWHVPDAEAMTWVDDVRTIPAQFRAHRGALESELAETVEDAGLEGETIGLLDAEIPMVVERALSAACPGVELEMVESLWSDLVASPSGYDAERIERTAEIADAGLAALFDACKPGRSEREVCFAALTRMGELGAEFQHAAAISTHVDIGVYSSARANLQPFLTTETPLKRGEMFWVDLIVCNEGYYVDCDRTVSIGEPTDEQRRIYDVTREMYRTMVDAVEPGVTGRMVWEAGHDIAAAAGYGDALNAIYLGHATGITISEAPIVGPDSTEEIEAGQFLNVEPGVFVPDVGSACIESTLRVTDDGAEPINDTPPDLVVV